MIGIKFSVKAFIIFIFLSFNINFSQTLHIVEATPFDTFTPDELTIAAGDTVRWINSGGNHNIVADDGSFTSGAPSFENWTFDFVFAATGSFQYYCVVHGGPGLVGMAGVIIVENITGVDEEEYLTKFELMQNYPNPFNPVTNFSYKIAKESFVTFKIYDLLGKEVAKLINEEKSIGEYKITFNAVGLSSGMYIYKLTAGDFTDTKSFILLK